MAVGRGQASSVQQRVCLRTVCNTRALRERRVTLPPVLLTAAEPVVALDAGESAPSHRSPVQGPTVPRQGSALAPGSSRHC